MPSHDPRPEREQTDESLAVERANADKALLEQATANERKADDVLDRARDNADAVLSAARSRADAALEQPGAPDQPEASVEQQRLRADEVVRADRARADELVRRDRAVRLARLFPIERDKTDLYLLTERDRSDEALASRDDFLGMVSHDLRDLLNAIVLNTAFIVDAAGEDEAGKPTVAAARGIERAVGRMNRLIGDLVDVASIDAGKLAMFPRAAEVASLVADAVATWAPMAAAKGVTLEVGPSADATTAVVDHHRILQVLANLITNAVKFSARGSSVLCGVEVVDDGVRFFVRDTGVGIPEDKLTAIFERFWQVGTDRRGLGLGLYIAKCIVLAHGGTIWAESTPGQGSTFFFTVPRAR